MKFQCYLRYYQRNKIKEASSKEIQSEEYLLQSANYIEESICLQEVKLPLSQKLWSESNNIKHQIVNESAKDITMENIKSSID